MINKLTITGFILFISGTVFSQHMINGFFKSEKDGSICLSYSWERYDDFYFGDMRGSERPVKPLENNYGGHITTQTVSIYLDYGITNDLEVVMNIPYIHSQGAGESGDGNPDQEVSSFQDISLFLKWRPVKLPTSGGVLSFTGAAGVSTPLNDYKVKQLLSIGNGSTSIDGMMIVHYKHNNGAFIDFLAGYSFRSNDVPNASSLGLQAGYAHSKYFVNAFSQVQISDSSAPDIADIMVGLTEGEDPPFNETRVNYAQIGVGFYYKLFPSIGGTDNSLGVATKVGRYIWGRNVGIPLRLSGSLILNF